MSDKDYLRQRLKELDETRKAKGIQRANFNELNNSINSNNNSSSSDKSNNNSNLKNSKTINHTQNLDNLNSQKIDNSNYNSLNLGNQISYNKNTSNFKDEISDGNQTESNLDKSKIPKRDYDKEPIILRNYELFFAPIFGTVFILSVASPLMIMDFIDKGYSLEFYIIVSIFLLFTIMTIILSYILFIKKHNYQIILKNNSIDFYKNEEILHKSNCYYRREIIVKPFWWYFEDGYWKWWLIIYIVFFLFLPFFMLSILISYYINVLLFKILIHIAISKNLKDFKLFNSICIDEPFYPSEYVGDTKLIAGRYYMIYFFDDKTYDELRTYFLDREYIDIDKVRKNYSVM